MKILVIDDDAQIRLMLREMLAWEGYDVLEAANGREGLLVQRQQAADLVITDLIMPEQEGLETITFLKSEFPDLKIIAVSGGGRVSADQYLPMAQEFGADMVFSKPFDIRQLSAAVKQLLGAQ
ncbi:MAG: response regulator [Desulfobulbaceae bacterium]|nr:response regulator [Desulfobulbaceae bacterium]